MMVAMANTPFMVDWSNWQSAHTLASMDLLQKNGLTGAVTRGGFAVSEDLLLATIVNYFRVLRIPYGLYWYLYPGVPAIDQVNAFIKVLNKYPDATCGFFLDLEEYKSITGVVFTKAYLEKFYLDCYTKLVSLLPGKKIGIYTAVWCVSTYFPAVTTWLPKTNGWYADYVKYYRWYQDYITSLGGSWGDNTKPISISNMSNIFAEIGKRKPNIPVGMVDCGIWQCITFIPFKELTIGQRNLDYNLLTPAAWKYWFNVTVETPPTPPLPPPLNAKTYVVTTNSLRIRSGPGIQYPVIGGLNFNDIILVTEELNGFAKFNLGWASLMYLAPVMPLPPITGKRYIAIETVFIRSTVGLPLGGKIGYVNINEVVEATELADGWLKLSTGGYVSGKYFKVYGG